MFQDSSFQMLVSFDQHNMTSSSEGLASDIRHVKIVVLGAAGVGKTSIIRQFMYCAFKDEYAPTAKKQVHLPTCVVNDHLYHIRLTDCPAIMTFPHDYIEEWEEFEPGTAVRNANAYLLVYDKTSEESFTYLKNIREQILENINSHEVPIWIVCNKCDLPTNGLPKREIANMVKKQWKTPLVECSAKTNWHIILLFKELLKTIDYLEEDNKNTLAHSALRRKKCVIM